MSYNYSRFESTKYNLSNVDGVEVGQPLPDVELSTVDGKRVTLHSLLGQLLVLETGSITCPIYAGRIRAMNELARDFPDVQFVVLYVREAHPGATIRAHDTLEDKIGRARQLRSVEPEERLILVDDLEGSLHQQLGALPNMVYVIDATVRVRFRADWNDVSALRKVLDFLMDGRQVSSIRAMLKPVLPWQAIPVLTRAGKGALRDFLVSLPNLMYQHLRGFWCKRVATGC